jgi:hypothetical protein
VRRSSSLASSWLSCVHTFNGTRYDPTPLRDAVFDLNHAG